LSIERTFALSYERLDTRDSTDIYALALLTRAAYFAPGELIPRDLLLATLTTLELTDDNPTTQLPMTEILRREDALKRLIQLGLLEPQQETALRLHRLLATFVRMRIGTTNIEAQADVEQVLLKRVTDL